MSLNPSPAAVETARRNGERDFAKYDLTQGKKPITHLWAVRKHGDPLHIFYLVNVKARTCDCAYCQQEGICKHLYIVDETIRIEFTLQAMIDEKGEDEPNY